MTTPDLEWPVNFSVEVRAIILARDTPDGRGWPVCVVCGHQADRIVRVHHRRYKSRGGDGRPSNGIVVHDGCHRRIHDLGRDAALAGWAISRHGPAPACYAAPLWCAWRGPIVLLDAPGPDGRHWRPATPEEAVTCCRTTSLSGCLTAGWPAPTTGTPSWRRCAGSTRRCRAGNAPRSGAAPSTPRWPPGWTPTPRSPLCATRGCPRRGCRAAMTDRAGAAP